MLYDLDANSLMTGFVFGALLVLSVVAMVVGAKRPEQPEDHTESEPLP